MIIWKIEIIIMMWRLKVILINQKKKEKPKFIPKQHDLRRRSNSEITNKKQKLINTIRINN